MPRWLIKIFVLTLSLAALFYVIYYTTPPTSWESASLLQISIFFLPIIVAVTALTDLLLKNIARSLLVGLTVMFLIVLESLYLLNIITSTIIILCLLVLIYIFNTPINLPIKKDRLEITKKLTTEEEIPKLTKFQQKRRQRRRK